MSTPGNQNKFDWGVWIAIVVLFGMGLWPISLILLARQLTGAGKKKARAVQAGQASTRPRMGSSVPKPSSAQTTRSLAISKSKFPNGKGLTIAGGVVSGIFTVSFLSRLLEALSWGTLEYQVMELGMLLGFFCLGMVLLFCGLARTRKGKRYRTYLGLIGKRKSVSIAALTKTTGIHRRLVLDDLQDMLNSHLFPTGYLDLSRDLLVFSEDGIPDEEPKPKVEQIQDDNSILVEIRAVNDAIPDPVMSAKIDRIGEITGKILDYQRQNPNKSSQLRSFLNYYLPTTLKILRSYAQLDAQGVEGENISAAKARIEGMMDKVVEGFENQLDKLFQDSAMDISSDVSVLEQMLEKDGLSGQDQGMPLSR